VHLLVYIIWVYGGVNKVTYWLEDRVEIEQVAGFVMVFIWWWNQGQLLKHNFLNYKQKMEKKSIHIASLVNLPDIDI
jgi:hypothetical protein